jgi:Ca2+-binding EF-hand superfamily protein
MSAQDTKDKAEKKMQWMDKDLDGAISKTEMLAFYEGKKDKKGRSIKAGDIFVGTDHNNDGKITVDELQKKVNWKKANKSKSKNAIKTVKKGKAKLPTDKIERKLFWMDSDKNKSVSLNEMLAFFKGKKDKKGKAISGNHMFIGFDANDDGKVTLDELKKGVNWKKINQSK